MMEASNIFNMKVPFMCHCTHMRCPLCAFGSCCQCAAIFIAGKCVDPLAGEFVSCRAKRSQVWFSMLHAIVCHCMGRGISPQRSRGGVVFVYLQAAQATQRRSLKRNSRDHRVCLLATHLHIYRRDSERVTNSAAEGHEPRHGGIHVPRCSSTPMAWKAWLAAKCNGRFFLESCKDVAQRWGRAHGTVQTWGFGATER